MVYIRLAGAIAQTQGSTTQTRTATVKDVLPPTGDETDVITGWQVLLDFGGGEIRRAGVASMYNPIPGDVVAVARYLNTLFVIGKVTAGESGEVPGDRIAYNYIATPGNYATGTGTETALGLPVTAMMRTGAAYSVRLRTGYFAGTANTVINFRLRQDAVGGTDIGEYFRAPATLASQQHGFDMTIPLRNDTGIDLNINVVPTFTSPASVAATMFCTAQSRAFIEVRVLGSSKLYPYAAAVSVPAGTT